MQQYISTLPIQKIVLFSLFLWIIVNGRFLSLQIISNLCFKLTEIFFMEYSFHVIVSLSFFSSVSSLDL